MITKREAETDFAWDVTERSIRAFIFTWLATMLEAFVNSNFSSFQYVHATYIAGGSAMGTVMFSFIARHIGVPGTASVLRRIFYRQKENESSP